jgi:hypothetical protein
LYVLGTLSVIASSVSSNSAVGGSGGRGGAAGAGGPATVGQSVAPPGGSGGSGNVPGTAIGGGIYVSGASTLSGTTVFGNAAAGGTNGDGANGGGGGSTSTKGATGGEGGNGGSGGGTVGNVLGAEGGGLYGPGNIGNSTFAANSAIGGRGGDAGAGGDGGSGPAGPGPKGASGVGGDGADAMGGGMLWLGEGTWSLVNDTIDGNLVTGGTFGSGTPTGVAGTGDGGGGWMQGGTLANSIVAGDKAFSGAAREDTSPDCGGELTTGGHNVIGALDGCRGIVAGTNGDEGGTFTAPLDPKLALLGSYGGPTLTMAETPGSPAIRHASAATCESTAIGDKDQRGYPRLSARRGACDAGAYDSAEPEKLAVATPGRATNGTRFSLTVTAVDPFGHIVTSFRDTVRFTSTDNTAKLPKNYTFTSADGGSHGFSVTLGSIGNQTITVTDTAAPIINATSATIRVS